MLEEKRSKIEGIVSKSDRFKARVLLAAVLFSVGLFLFWPLSPELPEGYAGAGSDTVHQTGMDAAASFNITDTGVSPASQRVELGKAVGFRNQIDSTVSISFDRSNDTVSIPSGGSKTVFINGITYFQVDGEDDYSARGRVNIQ